MKQQFQLRKDINYLADNWVAPKIFTINGDVNKAYSFDKLPVLLTFIRKEKVKTIEAVSQKRNIYRVENLLLVSKLAKEANEEKYSEEYDLNVGQMTEVIEKIWQGLTSPQVNEKQNPFFSVRKYASEGDIEFTDDYFEFGANRYMGIRSSYLISAPKSDCFDCSDFKEDTFLKTNLPIV